MDFKMNITKKLAHFDLDLDLNCPAGKLLALVGPSGSGKTTAIRLIAGLEKPDHGTISLGRRILCDPDKKIWLPPEKRKLGYVFQEAGLFPHLRVRANVAFACKDPARVDMLLEMLSISHLADEKPARISGGERQRAAFAQALAAEPQLLLLDEPFSALDIDTRDRLQLQLIELKKEFNIPMILVTHDLPEAVRLGDEVIALENGRTDTGWLERLRGIVFPERAESLSQIPLRANKAA